MRCASGRAGPRRSRRGSHRGPAGAAGRRRASRPGAVRPRAGAAVRRPSRGRAGARRGRRRGCSAGTTAREAAARGTTVPSARFRPWARRGGEWPPPGRRRGRSGRRPARRVVHSRSFTVLTAHRRGRLAAIVPRAGAGRTGSLLSFVPSFVGGSPGRLGGWLIRTCKHRWVKSLPRFPCSVGTSFRKVPYWCSSTRRGCPRRRSSWSVRMCPRWCGRSGRWRCEGSAARDRRGYGVALAAARGYDVAEAAGLLEGRGPPR